ncbi:iron donor protein CyaY [archaeon]|nr:MAG: iron donor protein CyaY [archaeon]
MLLLPSCCARVAHRLGHVGIARTWMTVRVPEVRFASISVPPSASNEDVEYHARADAALHWLETEFGSVEDCADDIEVSLSQGVLTLEMGDARGTIVVNKQSAARQIWSSSPRAGPRRYAFDAATRTWRSTRDHAELATDLGKEIQAHLPAWRGFSGPLHG